MACRSRRSTSSSFSCGTSLEPSSKSVFLWKWGKWRLEQNIILTSEQMSIAFSHCTCYRSPEILKILYQVLGSKMSSNANVPTPALLFLSTCPHPKEPAFTDGCFFFSIQWCSAVNTFKDFPITVLYNTFKGFPIVLLSNSFKYLIILSGTSKF